jgi:hypothetical protein
MRRGKGEITHLTNHCNCSAAISGQIPSRGKLSDNIKISRTCEGERGIGREPVKGRPGTGTCRLNFIFPVTDMRTCSGIVFSVGEVKCQFHLRK